MTPECIRCGEPHVFLGRFSLKYDDNMFGPIEQLVEACLPDERVFVYRCPQCGKLEFFAHDTDHDMKNQEMACFECGGPIGPGAPAAAGAGRAAENSLTIHFDSPALTAYTIITRMHSCIPQRSIT